MTRPALIAAVLADPDALWAILTADAKNVAGPWERRGRSCFRRQTDSVYPVASVVPLGYANEFQAFVFKNQATPADKPMSCAEAEAWCDEQLRKAGWLLATGVADG